MGLLQYASSTLRSRAGCLVMILCVAKSLCSKEDSLRVRDFAPSFSHSRFWGVTGGMLATYGGALGGLSYFWYRDASRSSFHFFNDGREWLGMDKAGHAYAGYFMSRWITGLYRWSGVKQHTALVGGSLSALVLLSSIEILDGFSAKWGFSGWDVLANAGGVLLMAAQELAWKEQRITLKMSSFPQSYPHNLRSRTNYLFGNSFPETVVKDYNALTVWASLNIHAFMKRKRHFPRWLNIAVGYGAEGLLGGFANRWCAQPQSLSYCACLPENRIDRSDVQRYAQFYLSLDVDFTRIKTRRPGVKALLHLLNLIKLPAPAVEFNMRGKVIFHPLFF
ncbi:MAG: DUF2279 domain-containing protein [Chitinophagales bacterium]|nr:MAG: DUF2279 domain-containing protein [Chitinophagales bacterium]